MKDIDGWKSVLTDQDRAKKYREYVTGWEKKIGSLLEWKLPEAGKIKSSEGILASVPFAVKDNIAVEGFKLTCGSKILEYVKAPYTATGVANLQKTGALVMGKANLDEFGMGSSTDNSALQKTNNPYDTSRVAGGSSGGSAAAVAAGIVPFALGTDTGGSVRQPAGFCGVYGLKPTYGVVSRYGLTAYASSLEVCGVCARTVDTTRTVFHAIRGMDGMDQTTIDYDPVSPEVKTVGVLKVEEGSLSEEVAASYRVSKDRLNKLGYAVKEIEIPAMEYVVPAYYTIATAEASANLARFNGMRYGLSPIFAESPDDLMRYSRNMGFGEEVKTRILLGTFVLRSGFQDQYYVRAQKIRTLIRQELDEIFTDCDVIMLPVFPTAPFHHGQSELTSFQQKQADVYTCLANMTGSPGLAVPSTLEKGLPVGVQFMAPPCGEERLFTVAEALEKEFPAPRPAGYSEEWRA
ncbi:MAG: Asp-tRNA(Asn)/Glu-tRNA(Gln) amidotransferase subunit GatA [Spirochaetales bacterium]|nr:Asp-tRNA(Asn)/Glu-tRNA(Gln) amidotransferase subunit GatA [Spirochaetales bacterium]